VRPRHDGKGGIVRGRLGAWVILVAMLAACSGGPASPAGPPAAAAPDQTTDVWFMQHMVPHLWQTISITSLTRDRIAHPPLVKLADTITRRSQADIDQLQEWLAVQGLSPHGHSHQRVDSRALTDLERLSRLGGTGFDLAFLQVMTARDGAGVTMAATEVQQGGRPEVRQLARRLQDDLQAEIRQLHRWRQAWSRPPAVER
jgi:uncharacterized protein (DUF305 family)